MPPVREATATPQNHRVKCAHHGSIPPGSPRLPLHHQAFPAHLQPVTLAATFAGPRAARLHHV